MRNLFIAIAGPPCSGKSTSGAILAKLLSLDFAETDDLIEKSSERSIGWIFSNLGEKVFRAREKNAVEKILSGNGCVVALGGGTLLDRDTRNLVESRCRIFTLWAPLETLVARNTGGRPLAATESMFRQLLCHREEHYASLPGRLCTQGMTPEEVAIAMARILRKEDPAP